MNDLQKIKKELKDAEKKYYLWGADTKKYTVERQHMHSHIKYCEPNVRN
jgi:hypothetical protein